MGLAERGVVLMSEVMARAPASADCLDDADEAGLRPDWSLSDAMQQAMALGEEASEQQLRPTDHWDA